MKKLISLISILTMFLMFSLPVHADNNTINFDEYSDWRIEEVSSFSEGIVPIKIKNQEELDNLLLNTPLEDNSTLSSSDITIRPYGSGNYYVTISNSIGVAYSKVNLYADVELYHYNNFREIVGAKNMYTTLTGFTMGHNWEEKNIDYSILNGGRSIKVTANGTFHYYIILEGIGRIISKDTSVTASYSAY